MCSIPAIGNIIQFEYNIKQHAALASLELGHKIIGILNTRAEMVHK
jgi:hypothetical protein